jgi:acetyl-CoA/propionyl-CoA carboxylase biotin carboxyl carrier protein
VDEGATIPDLYDPMIAKLIVHGVDREHARHRMLRALDEFEIGGVQTLLGFHRALLVHPCFVAAETCHGVVESEEFAQQARELSHETTIAGSPDGAVRERALSAEVDGRRYEVRLLEPEPAYRELARRRRGRGSAGAGGAGQDVVSSPMQGTVLSVAVAEGDHVEPGQVLCVVEAMKMENEVHATRDGVVADLTVAPGQPVATGQAICRIVVDETG